MKIFLSLFAGMALSTAISATLPDGSIAPNWTFTDINGNSWTLYDLTAEGKTVFIDVSTSWCGGCWYYHNTHALRDIYDQYGPNGTVIPNELMVFYMECDSATTLADLNGTGSNTTGDWITGTTYPIIDLGPASVQFNNDYDIGSFPTIYKVCPDNTIYDVGQPSAPLLLNRIHSCTFPTDVYPGAGPIVSCNTTFAPTVEIRNNGSLGLTSVDIVYAYDTGAPAIYNWTGALAAGDSIQVSLPPRIFTTGSHTVDITMSNPNGGLDNNNINDAQSYVFTVTDVAPAAVPYTNDISATGFPYPNWGLNNPDDSITWAHDSVNGGSLKLDLYTYGIVETIDEFTIEPIDLSYASQASIRFNMAYTLYASCDTDALEVLVSVDCGVTWSSVWMKTAMILTTHYTTSGPFIPIDGSQWRTEQIDLSAYAGQSNVVVMFRATNGYWGCGNNLYIDDINVSVVPADLPVNMNVYPNPADHSANVSFLVTEKTEVTVNVYNTLGEIVYTQNQGEVTGNRALTIDTDNFANGMYMVELVTGETRTASRMCVSH